MVGKSRLEAMGGVIGRSIDHESTHGSWHERLVLRNTHTKVSLLYSHFQQLELRFLAPELVHATCTCIVQFIDGYVDLTTPLGQKFDRRSRA